LARTGALKWRHLLTGALVFAWHLGQRLRPRNGA
jgi:hypothetical protein